MKKIIEKEKLKLLALRLYFILAALESTLTLAYLLATPSDPKNSIFLGYSAQRLGMIGLALGALLVHGFIARKLLTRQMEMKWFHRLTGNWVLIPLLAIAAVLLIAGWLVLVALNERIPQDYLPYFNRVYPLNIWLSVLAFEILVLFPIAIRYSLESDLQTKAGARRFRNHVEHLSGNMDSDCHQRCGY